MSAAPDFDRLRAAMMAARAQATGRTLAQVQEDIHQERLRILAEDSPPEDGESGDRYIARVTRKHGLAYFDAALELVEAEASRQSEADALARTVITRAMRKPAT